MIKKKKCGERPRADLGHKPLEEDGGRAVGLGIRHRNRWFRV